MIRFADRLNRRFRATLDVGTNTTELRPGTVEGTHTVGYTLSLASTAFAVNAVVAAITTDRPFSLEYLDVQLQPRASPGSAGLLTLQLYRKPNFALTNATQPSTRYMDNALSSTVAIPSGAGVLGTQTPTSNAYAIYTHVAVPVVFPSPQPLRIFQASPGSSALFCPSTETLALIVTSNTLPAINFSLDVNYQIKTYVTGTTAE